MNQVPSEAELVARCKHELPHHQQSFELLVMRYQHKVFTLCYRLTGNSASAEDLMQEILMKVFFSLRNFEGRSSFSSWLYRISHNHCLNFLAQRKRELEKLNEYAIDSQPAQIMRTEVIDFSVEMQTVLNQMREESRSVLIMKYVLELELNEIGEILNTSLGAVKMRLSRAREEFRRIQKQQENKE